jgi:hypothetical protein
MKCTTALITFIATASAASIERYEGARHHKRGAALDQVIGIMTPVLNGLNSYDGTLQCFNGGDSTGFKNAGTTLLTTVKTAVANLGNMTANLTMDEAYGFQSTSDSLNKAGDSVIGHLGDKKAVYQAWGLCSYINPFVNDLCTFQPLPLSPFPGALLGSCQHANVFLPIAKPAMSTI